MFAPVITSPENLFTLSIAPAASSLVLTEFAVRCSGPIELSAIFVPSTASPTMEALSTELSAKCYTSIEPST